MLVNKNKQTIIILLSHKIEGNRVNCLIWLTIIASQNMNFNV